MQDKEAVPCLNCTSKATCEMNTVLDNTLNASKKHKLLSLQLEILVTTNEPLEFGEDFAEDCAEDITQEVFELYLKIDSLLKGIDCDIAPVKADLSLKNITNKRAFNKLVDYIKVTHNND